MIFVDVGAVIIMLALAGAAVAVVRGDKSKAKEAANLRFEMQKALNARNKATLQDFLVLWNDRLTKDQKDALKQRIDEFIIQENP